MNSDSLIVLCSRNISPPSSATTAAGMSASQGRPPQRLTISHQKTALARPEMCWMTIVGHS
jgi:hypothetical protein